MSVRPMHKDSTPEPLEDDADPVKFDQIVSVRFSKAQVEAFRRLAKRVGTKPGTVIRMKALEAFDWERFLREDEAGRKKG